MIEPKVGQIWRYLYHNLSTGEEIPVVITKVIKDKIVEYNDLHDWDHDTMEYSVFLDYHELVSG